VLREREDQIAGALSASFGAKPLVARPRDGYCGSCQVGPWQRNKGWPVRVWCLWVAYNSFPDHRSEHSGIVLKIPCSLRDLSSVPSPEKLKQLVNSWGKLFPTSDRMSAGQYRSFNVAGGYYVTVHDCQSDDVRCRRVVCDRRSGKHCDRLERGG